MLNKANVLIKSLHLLLLLLLSACLTAQESPLFFQQINRNHGLSNDHVNCILQDSRGFTWIGTNDGLNRYDGRLFTIFRRQPQNQFSIAGNIITHIAEDGKGYLWIATADGGISRYDHRSPPEKQFTTYQYDPADKRSIPGNIINSLLLDDKGMLWLATSGRGIIRFNTQTGSFYQLPVHTASTILDLELTADGKIWAGIQGRGIVKIDPLTMGYETDERYNDPYKKLPHVVVAAIYKDSRDDIWIGNWDKTLYRYKKGTTAPEQITGEDASVFNNDDALCFAEDNKDMLWIGGKFNGLYILDRKDNSIKQYSHNPLQDGTIAHNRINCIYKDREGNLWLGTARGISLHRPLLQQFTQTFLPSVNNELVKRIHDFTEDEQQTLYIAADKGIFLQKKGMPGFQYIPLLYNGERMQASKFYWYNKQLLVGTNISLFVVDPVKKQCNLLPNTDKDVVMKKIIESRVVSIAEDSLPGSRILWAVPYGHYLAYYDFTAQQWVSRQDSIKKIIANLHLTDNLIRKIIVDKSGTRWIATAKEGLGRMKKNETGFTYFSATSNKSSGLLATDVYDVLPDRDGNIWVSSNGGGLFYGSGQPLSFKYIEGSPNLCEGMQLDEKQNLWFISGNSIYKYKLAEDKFTSWQVPDIEKSGGIGAYLFKSREDDFYAAGNNYFVKFQPSALYKRTTPSTIYITDLKINARSQTDLLFTASNRFSFWNNTLSFEFSAPKVPDDEPLWFEYRMKGLDTKWTMTEASVQNFPNLQPGDYTFEVRVAGSSSEKEIASFSFTIIPPFYRTWWFFTLCGFIIAAAVYGLYRYRINQLLQQQAMRNKIAQDLHDSVGSTLSSISVYSQVAKIYKQQEKQNELQDALEKISITSGEMISEMNDIVWAINPRNDNMNIILQRMESYAKPLLQAKGISFRFNYDPAILLLNLEMEQRKNFYLIFKEAVNNALKYAGCRHLEVDVKVSGKFIELLVQDDGVGFDMEQMKLKTAKSLSGNGLNNMKRRAADMKGECQVSSSPGKGTTVRLRFLT